jgi:Cap4 dsDNA endonuclease
MAERVRTGSEHAHRTQSHARPRPIIPIRPPRKLLPSPDRLQLELKNTGYSTTITELLPLVVFAKEMSEPIPLTPETAPSTDAGDETASRFRYQWICAATVSCMILDPTEDTDEIFCEQFEDILQKHSDNTFSGLQVKTRASDQPLWKATDDAIRSSCARFAKLEGDFPGLFRKYNFLTNHPLQVSKNGQDIRHILDAIRGAKSLGELTGVVKTYLGRVARDAGCPENIAFAALSKTRAYDDLPKLNDATMRLVNDLVSTWDRASELTLSRVKNAAGELITECFNASSLEHRDTLPAYLSATGDPVGTELMARVSGKRIDKARLIATLERGMNATAPLEGDLSNEVLGVGDRSLLVGKLDAGGFSAPSINSAEDLRDKAEYLGIKWTKVHGRENGLQRFNHIRSVVLREAANSYEYTHGAGDPFGISMLAELRERLQSRRSAGTQLYDCSDDHLEGVAFALTSECKVQWSDARPWEDE